MLISGKNRDLFWLYFKMTQNQRECGLTYATETDHNQSAIQMHVFGICFIFHASIFLAYQYLFLSFSALAPDLLLPQTLLPQTL
jgi:hypothetical protein